MVFGLPFLVEWEFSSVGFRGVGKTRVAREKPLGARERTNNKLNSHMALTPRYEPRPYWWDMNVLNTAPPFLPKGKTT